MQIPGPPGWGLGVVPITPPRKNKFITETAENMEIDIENIDTVGESYENSSQHHGIMTASGESPTREASCSMVSFLDPKTTIHIGAWNVKTMYQLSKTAQVINEMKRCHLNILGISECRWTGAGRIKSSDGFTIIHSGKDEEHSSGVALILSKDAAKSLIEWEPISDRLIRARFDSKYCKLTIIQCYAPTNQAEDESKDEWYEQLQRAVSKVPHHDMLLIIGDMNAKVGSDNSDRETAMGRHGCGEINNNGERLVDFCLNNNCVIGGTLFPHKDIHKLTWKSPDGITINQIDHIIINNKWRGSLKDVRVYRKPDVNSDHYMLAAAITLKLKANHTNHKQRKIFDIAKLRTPRVQKAFTLELRNRFAILEHLNVDPDQQRDEDTDTVEESWSEMKEAYIKTAENIIGFRQKKDKKWLSETTWKRIDERRKIKENILEAKSERIKTRYEEEYTAKDREVKTSARNDKRKFVDELADEAEQAAARGELSTVYKITKELTGHRHNNYTPVRNKEGQILTTETEQAERWVQHFTEVLNQPDPEILADPIPSVELDIDCSLPKEKEVKAAIKRMKNNKAPGIDTLQAELLKVDINTSSKIITNLFKKIWEKEEVPEDWDKGLIFKLPKKGDLKNCDNWRGITLLSIPSKIFCWILLKRIDSAIDVKLRQEQAGFRKGRGCIDQIFALRNIIEQCIEWNTPLYINFIDFKKAFDSIHRECLWKILRNYGIPQKIVDLIRLFYRKFECSIILDNTLSQWFEVKSGVRQGCILSPLLFLITIDWVMRRTTADRPRGIQWNLFRQLEDLDFADDLAVLSSNHGHLQEKTRRLSQYAKQTGLTINRNKTKIMTINALAEPITLHGEPFENVDDFTYLGSIISKENGVKKDISARLNKARGAFSRLRNIWKSKQFKLKTKLRIYNSNVKSVLLYGSECWRVVKEEMNKLNAFHNGCLRKICNIYWPNKISNEDLYIKTGCNNIIPEIKRRRWRWLGHVMRMSSDRIPKIALRWTPAGSRRRRGRPKLTWRRTVEAELGAERLSWGEAESLSKNRIRWNILTAAVYSTWSPASK